MKKITSCLLLFLMVCSSACAKNTTLSSVEPNSEPIRKILADVPNICQNPTLPTGCETTAAVMVMQYYKEDITIIDFAEHCLKKSNDFYWNNGQLFGPDPKEVFVGDPYSENGYGCFAPVIVNAVNENSRLCQAERVEGTLPELCKKFIDKGKPLLIWATSNMKPPQRGHRWRLSNAEYFTWPLGEHCLVLVGYDKENYYFNDSLKGETVGYSRSEVEICYEALGSQAVLIDKYE